MPARASTLRRLKHALVGARQRYKIPKAGKKEKLGHGTEAVVYAAEVTTPNGKRALAEKRYFIDAREKNLTKNAVRQQIIRAKRTYVALKRAGLPVPAFYVPMIRKNRFNMLRVLMENLELKYGKIEPVNEKRVPVFLRKLHIAKDRELIMHLAQDLATIHALGYTKKLIDMWMFYPKGKSYGRVLVDYGELTKSTSAPEFKARYAEDFAENKQTLQQVLGKEEYALFMKTYLHSFEKAQMLLQVFK